MNNAKVLTLTLFREKQFQVELVVAKPAQAPWPGEHRHPHVDSFEVALYNNYDFTKNGRLVDEPDLRPNVAILGPHGIVNLQPACVRLLPTDWHGASPRVEGASLLSVQRWADGTEPTSVGLDWEGPAVDESHRKQQDALKAYIERSTTG